MNDFDRAEKLFGDFFDSDPEPSDIREVKGDNTIVAIIGEVNGISYTTTIDGKCETYYHEFDTRPVFAISSDGYQIYILAGEYKFTEKGIEG